MFDLFSNLDIEKATEKVRQDSNASIEEFFEEQNRFSTAGKVDLPDEPGNNILNNFLKGAIMKTPQRVETFEEFFDRRKPGLHFLNDFFRGFTDTALGRETRTVRDDLFKEFQVEQRGKIAEQSLRERNAQTAMQLAVAMRNVNLRESGATERQTQRLTQEAVLTGRRLDIMGERLGLEEDRIGIARDAHELAKERFNLTEEESKKFKIPTVELARQALLPGLLEQAAKDGVDPESPEFHKEAMDKYIGYALALEKSFSTARARPTSPGTSMRPRFGETTDSFGRKMFIMRFEDGRVMRSTLDPDKPLEPLRKGQVGFSAKRVGELQAQRDAARMMNQVLETFYANPDVIGLGTKVQNTLPGGAVQSMIELVKATGLSEHSMVREALDKFETQRSFASQLSVLVALQTRAFTGAQMTDKERDFIEKTLPTGISEEEMISLLSGRAAILRLTEARERLGIRVGKFDADVSFDKLMARVDYASTEYAKSSTKRLKDLSAEEVEDYLSGREHLISKHPNARLIEVAPLRWPIDVLFREAAEESGRPEFIKEVEELIRNGDL